MVKYKKYVKMMLEDNAEIFDDFQKLHDEYAKDEDGFQKRFNEEGEKILEIVREYENRLCRDTERGVYIRFSSKLAEKFQDEVKKVFPMIDHVGLIVEESVLKQGTDFEIKKINLT